MFLLLGKGFKLLVPTEAIGWDSAKPWGEEHSLLVASLIRESQVEFERANERAERPPIAECHRQMERILQSQAFRNASTLQQLFQFLTTRALDGGAEPLKEYTIGVEAFGRMKDFDPKTDTIVRVQTHRLRQKLKEYYDGEGRTDRIVIEIPKGHYLPRFEILPDERSQGGSNGHLPNTDHALPEEIRSRRRLLPMIIGTLALIAVFGAGWLIGRRSTGGAVSDRSIQSFATGQDPVKAFWASFVGDDLNPVIAYPDAVFLLDNSNDLFRYRQGASDDRGSQVNSHLARQFASNPELVARAGELFYENGYTGAGELQAVAMLAGLFGQMGLKPIIKPSRDITPVDLRQHSVILLGSSFQNVAVAQLMMQGDFRFRNPDQRLEQWRAEIVNTRPRQGEATSYHTQRDEQTRGLTQDFGIFSVQSGVVAGRHIAVLGGLDTTGTEGVTLYATSLSGIEELGRLIGIQRGPAQPLAIPQFQALVRVRLEKGYEVLGASVEAVHTIEAVSGERAPSPATSRTSQ